MPKIEHVLTVEITETHLKCAFLSLIKDVPTIVNVAVSELGQTTQEAIVSAIKDFIKKCPSRKFFTINVIPSNLAIYKNIEIPSIDNKEIKEIIELQAGRHTPYSKEEIIMDYLNVGVIHERYTKILLIIVKKEVVSKRYDIIKQAGYKADIAALSCEGIARWCPQFCPDLPAEKPMGIIHIDAATMDFNVSHHGKSIYIRSVPLNRVELSQQPQELQKKMVEEIKKSLDSYQADNIEAIPAKLYFTGATEGIVSSTEELKKSLGVEVELFDYGAAAKLPARVWEELKNNKNASLLSTIATALTYGQLKLNLIPEDVRLGREIKQRAREMIKMGILSMALLILFCIMLIANVFFKKVYLNKLLLSYTKETKEAEELKRLSARTGIIKKFLNKKSESLFVLAELLSATPKEILLSSVSFQDDATLIFTGTANSMSQVFSFVTDLENNKYFKNVKVDFTKSRRVQNQEVADFGLTLSLEEVW